MNSMKIRQELIIKEKLKVDSEKPLKKLFKAQTPFMNDTSLEAFPFKLIKFY